MRIGRYACSSLGYSLLVTEKPIEERHDISKNITLRATRVTQGRPNSKDHNRAKSKGLHMRKISADSGMLIQVPTAFAPPASTANRTRADLDRPHKQNSKSPEYDPKSGAIIISY